MAGSPCTREASAHSIRLCMKTRERPQNEGCCSDGARSHIEVGYRLQIPAGKSQAWKLSDANTAKPMRSRHLLFIWSLLLCRFALRQLGSGGSLCLSPALYRPLCRDAHCPSPATFVTLPCRSQSPLTSRVCKAGHFTILTTSSSVTPRLVKHKPIGLLIQIGRAE